MNLKSIITGLLASATIFSAGASNITIGDGNITKDAGYLWTESWMNVSREDNEVEPGCATGQNWDLEAFLLRGTALSMVAGYDLKNGEKDGNITIRTSDLFVDIGGSNGSAYDYVYDINWTSGAYSLYQIIPSGTIGKITLTPENVINATSNPISYTPGANQQILSSGTIGYIADVMSGQALVDATGDVAAGFLKGANNWGTYSTTGPNGDYNDFHNVASLDVSYFGGKSVTFHLTMECGNDDLRGHAKIPTVPEPAMLSFLGIGLLSMAVSFKVRKKR